MMFWAVLINRCRAFLPLVLQGPCQLVMFPEGLGNVAEKPVTILKFHIS